MEKELGKLLAVFLCVVLTCRVNANQLQTAFGVQHTVSKMLRQSGHGQASIASQDIQGYGQTQDANVIKSRRSVHKALNFYQDPFFYGSGYYDAESGLQYMGARYYSSKLSVFMAQDSEDLMNRYRYGKDNPIMYIDPDGHFAILPKDLLGYFASGLAIFLGIFSGGSTLPTVPLVLGFAGDGLTLASGGFALAKSSNTANALSTASFIAGVAAVSTGLLVHAYEFLNHMNDEDIKNVFGNIIHQKEDLLQTEMDEEQGLQVVVIRKSGSHYMVSSGFQSPGEGRMFFKTTEIKKISAENIQEKTAIPLKANSMESFNLNHLGISSRTEKYENFDFEKFKASIVASFKGKRDIQDLDLLKDIARSEGHAYKAYGHNGLNCKNFAFNLAARVQVVSQ